MQSLKIIGVVAAVVALLAGTHWVAFMEGRYNVMQNTAVMDIYDGQEHPIGLGRPFFGKCDPSGRICAVNLNSQTSAALRGEVVIRHYSKSCPNGDWQTDGVHLSECPLGLAYDQLGPTVR